MVESRAEVRAVIVVTKPGNSGGAKGCRIAGCVCGCGVFFVVIRVSVVAGAGPIINGGQMFSLPSVGCSLCPQPMQRFVSPVGGEPPTGEPCAGEPHARFGGGRDREYNRFFLPL